MTFKDEQFFQSIQKCTISFLLDIAWLQTNGVFIFLKLIAFNIVSTACYVRFLNVSTAQTTVGDLFLLCLT